MLILNTILQEIKDIPANRLEELYQFVHSLTEKSKKTDSARTKILSYGGAFSDMSAKDYSDFVAHTQKTRTQLFDRTTTL
jgi:hypothetical protein